MNPSFALFLGFDESTTKTGVGARGGDGRQQFVSINNRGETKWHGETAFDLAELPGMMVEVLGKLAVAGWRLDAGYRRGEIDGGKIAVWPEGGSPIRDVAQLPALSCSVRQHDLVLLDANDELLAPALTWQCNAATAEVKSLQAAGAEKVVGKIEERFILPKLMWMLAQDASLRPRVAKVMTTGDYVGYMLTGECRLSTSDAVSNGLLAQSNKTLASDVMRAAGLDPAWFPAVIPSGQVVGTVRVSGKAGAMWGELQRLLSGWRFVSTLGDNHATGVGCGGLVDDQTIVVSAGTSGTINRRVSPAAELRQAAACFEFYDDRMLLMMLADCGEWYQRFYERFGEQRPYAELNELAMGADLSRVRIVGHVPRHEDKGLREMYPADWSSMSLGEQVASTQLSIMIELLRLVGAMLGEVTGPSPVKAVERFVLTGGLSQSPLFQQAFHAGVQVLAAGKGTLVGAQTDELSYQTAAYGALINALLPASGGDLRTICDRLCPLKDAARPEGERAKKLDELMQKQLG